MSTLYMHAVHKNPYIYFLYGLFSSMGLLSRRAPSSGSPLALPPFGGAMTSLPLGLPRGTPHAGFPRTPSPRSPTKGIRPRAEASLRSALSS